MKKIGIIILILPLLSFTRKECYKEIIEQDIKHPTIVLAQAILETNVGTTGVGKTHYNLFGFKTKNGYIRFNSYKESITYYKKWQDKYYKGGDYIEFLKCLYKRRDGSCVAYNVHETYYSKLRRVINTLKLD